MEPRELLYEVEFKAQRLLHFRNPFGIDLFENQWVIVEAERGEDMGLINRVIDYDLPLKDKPRAILRVATYEDQEKLHNNRDSEEESRTQCEEMIARHKLEMKLVDVEYQFDCNKLTFYFTADQRVDFRALVKDLASHYRTRIELRQIGVRDEARRLGGYGGVAKRQALLQRINRFVGAPLAEVQTDALGLHDQRNGRRRQLGIQLGQAALATSVELLQPILALLEAGRQPGRRVVELFTLFHQPGEREILAVDQLVETRLDVPPDGLGFVAALARDLVEKVVEGLFH